MYVKTQQKTLPYLCNELTSPIKKNKKLKDFLATLKWRTIVGLSLVYASMWFNWPWIWGIIALFWVIPDLMTGTTFFMEPISKHENPFLYWFIVITWLLMTVYFISLFFYPDLQLY